MSTTPKTATITAKPSGSGSLNLPQESLEALGCSDGGPVAILIDERSVRLVPLEDLLLQNRG